MAGTAGKSVEVLPMDEHNASLVEHLHPPSWTNPTPSGKYNLVVVGAGPAGLVVAAGAAGLGAKVALIERHLMGGDCLNVGCVPSKCVIRSARTVAAVLNAPAYGVRVAGDVEADFPAVMKRMRRLRAGIAHHDSVERYQNELGVDVYLGDASFSSSNSVEVAGQTLHFSKAVVTTGARAAVPPIDGLNETKFFTNETIFELTELPRRLAVFGAGPIGCELAQTFQRFGSQVAIFDKAPNILVREDADASEILQQTFVREGIDLNLDCTLEKVEPKGAAKVVHFRKNGALQQCEVDEILVALGRAPNVEGLNLEGVGVEYDARSGVKIDDAFRTTNPNIYAGGDVAMNLKFTHAADAAARAIVRNTLFGFLPKQKLSSFVIPWCTYTQPEIAHVGLNEKTAEKDGAAIDTYKQNFTNMDRAVADGETEGFVKVHVTKGGDKILGATIVAAHAGEMINEITLAMTQGIGLGKIANVVHPYPTQAEAIRRVADAYNKTRMTPAVAAIFKRIIAWQR